MKLYTCVAFCRTCGKELNRAEHVPEDKRTRVAMAAPMVALCDVRDHNSLPDLNLGVVLVWTDEATGLVDLTMSDTAKMEAH
jgi:hypothetical protein